MFETVKVAHTEFANSIGKFGSSSETLRTEELSDDRGLVTYIPCITVDGEPWEDGINFIKSLIKPENGGLTNYETLKGIADDLITFRKFCYSYDIDYTLDHRLKPLRPTYAYCDHLKNSHYAQSTKKRKINRMISFYRWLMTSGVQFKYTLWLEKKKMLRYDQKVGLSRYKEITTTDLTPRSSVTNSERIYVLDEVGLFPLDEDEQQQLIQCLKNIDNYPVFLTFITSLVTAGRIQSVCTLRSSHFSQHNVKDTDVINILTGPGTGIDTKHSKPGTLEFPGWLYNKIKIYISSPDYLSRRDKLALQKHRSTDYVFVSTHGNPFYAAQDDLFYKARSWSPKGNSIRTFIHDQLKPVLLQKGFRRGLRFHDLRATSALNLFMDYLPMLEQGVISLDNLLKMAQEKLGHSKLEVTLQYLSLAKKHAQKKNIQSAWEDKILPRMTAVWDAVK